MTYLGRLDNYLTIETVFCTSKFNQCWADSENTHHKGKDRRMAGIQFNWIGFDKMRKYVVICLYCNYRIETIQASQAVGTVIPYLW